MDRKFRYYSSFEKEDLRMQVHVIALNHEVKGKSIMVVVARLKAKRLKADEIETIRKFCEAHQIDYDKVKPVKERR